MPDNTPQRVKDAIQALRSNDKAGARRLILEEVKENPSNLTAWLWALEVAANDREKRTILTKILSLDPTHQGALRYLKKLDQESSKDPQVAVTQPPVNGKGTDKPHCINHAKCKIHACRLWFALSLCQSR